MVPPNWQRERESEIHVPLETPQAECGKFGNVVACGQRLLMTVT